MSNPTPTKISTSYAKLVAYIQAALKDHKRLQFMDELERNPQTLLRQGWGLQIGAGSRVDRCITPQYARTQSFTLTIIRETVAKDTDVDKREAVKIWVLEDLHLVISALVGELTLEETCQSIVYSEDAGPEEIEVGGQPYVALDVTLSMEVIQQIAGG